MTEEEQGVLPIVAPDVRLLGRANHARISQQNGSIEQWLPSMGWL
jgi:hypothetical protein